MSTVDRDRLSEIRARHERCNSIASNHAPYNSTANLDIEYLLSEVDRLTFGLCRIVEKMSSLAIESIERDKELAEIGAVVQEWADAVKDGRLIKLPCKTGSRVYKVCDKWTRHNGCYGVP